MQIDSRNTVDTLRKLLDGLPNVIVLCAEIVLSTGVKIQMGNGCRAPVMQGEEKEGGQP